MQLADTQERHAQLDERVIEAERKLAEAREQQRTLERQAQEATLPSAAWKHAAASWSAPSTPPLTKLPASTPSSNARRKNSRDSRMPQRKPACKRLSP